MTRRHFVGILLAFAILPLVHAAMAVEKLQGHNPPVAHPPFIVGADISSVQEQDDQGSRFSDHGEHKDILAILKNHGFNWIRLRLFCNPRSPKGYSDKGYCDLDHTLTMAKRIKVAGMGLLLDFHYSDTWADPGHQVKPAAWTDLHGAELAKAVHDHTRDVVAALKSQGTPPDMVQIGNEISNGFLWPDGNVWKSGQWDLFCGLIKAGITGAKEVDPAVKIMIHVAWGGQNAQSRSFLDKAIAQGVAFDILGQSYYPKWHGTLDDLKANLTDLAGHCTFLNMPVGSLHCFKNESDKTARLLISVAPAGLEQMFFEVGTPLADDAETAPPPSKTDIEKLLEAAPRYSVEIKVPHE